MRIPPVHIVRGIAPTIVLMIVVGVPTSTVASGTREPTSILSGSQQVFVMTASVLQSVPNADADPVQGTRATVFFGILASLLFLGTAAGLWLRQSHQHRLIEAALRESEGQYRDLLEYANDLIQSVDHFGRFLYVNAAWTKTLGYSAQEAAEMTFLDIVHTDSRPYCEEVFSKLLKGEDIGRVDVLFVSKDGRTVDVEGSISTNYDGTRMTSSRGIFRDVTERRRQEAARLEVESRYRKIIENAIRGVFQITPRGKLLTANPALAATLGYESPEDLLTSVNQNGARLHAEPRKLVSLLRAMDKTGRIDDYEPRMVRKDGSTIWVSGTGISVRCENGDVASFEGSIYDITQRREAQEAHRASEQRFRTLADNAPVGNFLTDKHGQCIVVNHRYLRITGLERSKAVGAEWLEQVHPNDFGIVFVA